MSEQPGWSAKTHRGAKGARSLGAAVVIGMVMVALIGAAFGGWHLWQNRPNEGRDAFAAYAAGATVSAARLAAISDLHPETYEALSTRFVDSVNSGTPAAEAARKADGEITGFYKGREADIAAAPPTELSNLALAERELFVHVRATDVGECVLLAGRVLKGSEPLKAETRALFRETAKAELLAAAAGRTARRVYPTVGDMDQSMMAFHARNFGSPRSAIMADWDPAKAPDGERCAVGAAVMRALQGLEPESRAAWMSSIVQRKIDPSRLRTRSGPRRIYIY